MRPLLLKHKRYFCMKVTQTDWYAKEVGGKIFKNNITSQTFMVDQKNSERVVLWDPMGVTYAVYSPSEFKHLIAKGALTRVRYLLNMVYTSEGIHGNHRVFIGCNDLKELNSSMSSSPRPFNHHTAFCSGYSLMDVKSKKYLIPHKRTTALYTELIGTINTEINEIINNRKKWFPTSINIKKLFKNIGAGNTVTQENGRSKKL